MITTEQIAAILAPSFPGAQIDVSDMTGTMDHFEVKLIWVGFQGKSLMEQHRRVQQALAAALEDGRIHALKIKTLVPKS